MNLLELLKNEFSSFGKYERIFFPIVILVICIISFLTNDNKIALVSAVCGIGYTILAGKGKISCYFIGIAGTVCYSYIAFKNGFYGNLALYSLYYLPMDIIGISAWKKHLKKDTCEIKKVKLSVKERIIYLFSACLLSLILTFILKITGGKSPLFDSISVVFSVFGMFFTVKRCIEQWYIWFFVNLISLIMWLNAYLEGSNCLATVLMWFVYWVLAVYFLYTWNKEINKKF